VDERGTSCLAHVPGQGELDRTDADADPPPPVPQHGLHQARQVLGLVHEPLDLVAGGPAEGEPCRSRVERGEEVRDGVGGRATAALVHGQHDADRRIRAPCSHSALLTTLHQAET
jgi:hypothetical protein